MDSYDLIRRINPAKRFDDNSSFEAVFKHVITNTQYAETKEDVEIKADDNQVFFGRLKFDMQHKAEQVGGGTSCEQECIDVHQLILWHD